VLVDYSKRLGQGRGDVGLGSDLVHGYASRIRSSSR
jgi:hypothetical protein